MHKITIKSPEEVAIMREAGNKLRNVKKGLKKAVVAGENALAVEELAVKLIKKEGAETAFTKVKGYSWATCINMNDGVVHGIPKKDMVFKKGDIVSVDVGLYFNGFYSDTSFTVLVGADPRKAHFLDIGQSALKNAIKEARPGKNLGDISRQIEDTLERAGFSPIRALVGHGIGRELHEDPMVPCFTGYPEQNLKLVEGMVLAIEVMYTEGSPDIVLDRDGWTIRTKDGKMAALFEETVAITKDGPFILS